MGVSKADQHSQRPGAVRAVVGAKILSRNALLAERERLRRAGITLVQCHGCFDIVHPGHIRHLRQARAQGDALLVSITGDAGVGKGAGRPLIPEELRAENLAALDFVDYVHIEHRPTAIELLELVQPDVYVKGREYELNNDPRFKAEREAVERHAGRVVFSSGDVVFSSTALIASLGEAAGPTQVGLRSLLDRPGLDPAALTARIGAFRGKRIVVVGEAIQDTDVMCDRPEVMADGPTMTVRPVERRSFEGGAGALALHLARMGASPVLVTALGEGEWADETRSRLLAGGVEVRSIPGRFPPAERQRFLVGAQKVMEVDLIEPFILDARQQECLAGLAVDAACDAGGVDGAIIRDAGLGMLSKGVLAQVVRGVGAGARVTAGDVEGGRASLGRMQGLDLLTPTEREARYHTRVHDESLPTVAWRLLERTSAKAAIITMGAEGLVAFERRTQKADAEGDWPSRVRSEHVPAIGEHALDALGCGGALVCAATLALACGSNLLEASFLGALAGAIECQRLGNVPVGAAELRHAVTHVHNSPVTSLHPEVIAQTRAGISPRTTVGADA